MVVGGIQWVSRSYNLALTWRILAGDLSAIISSATTDISASQSGGGIGVLSETFSLYEHQQFPGLRVKMAQTHFCAWTASNINRARRRFLPLSLASRLLSPGQSFQPSFFPASFRTWQISSSEGAGTRTSSVLDRIGAMILAVVLASRINRIFGLYFSMVLLRAAWASLVRWSASLITTTLNRCLADWSTCCVCAISLRSSWITTRS